MKETPQDKRVARKCDDNLASTASLLPALFTRRQIKQFGDGFSKFKVAKDDITKISGEGRMELEFSVIFLRMQIPLLFFPKNGMKERGEGLSCSSMPTLEALIFVTCSNKEKVWFGPRLLAHLQDLGPRVRDISAMTQAHSSVLNFVEFSVE